MSAIRPHSRRAYLLACLAITCATASASNAAPLKPRFFETYRDHYVLPRAFPDSSIGDSLRTHSYQVVAALRRMVADSVGTNVQCRWRSIGPTNVNGRVTGIAFDPEDARTAFASTVGGLWRSRDAGRTWQRVKYNLEGGTLPPIRWACVAAAAGSNDVFAGSGDPNYAVNPFASVQDTSAGAGIWRSDSNGDSWTKVSPPTLDGATIFRLRIDPRTPHDVYAATSRGVWRGQTTASGMTWDSLKGVGNDPTKDFNDGCSDLVVDFDATGDPVLYAGVYEGSDGKGIWKYTGGAWHKKISGIDTSDPIGPIALAMAPTNHAWIYARIINSDTGWLHGIYRTKTGAEPVSGSHAWEVVTTSPPNTADANDYNWYNNVIEVSPIDAGILAVGGRKCFLLDPTTNRYKPISGSADASYDTIHEDVHALAFDPGAPNCLLAGNDGGLDRSTDLTTANWHWEHISHGMTTAEFYAVGTQDTLNPAVACGAQDNGTSMTFGNRTWYALAACDAPGVAVDATDALTLYTMSTSGVLEVPANPVTGTPGSPGTAVQPIAAGFHLVPPFAAQPSHHLNAVVAGKSLSTGKMGVFGLDPGGSPIGTQDISGTLATGLHVASVAISRTGNCLAGLAGIAGGVELAAFRGGSWHETSTNVPQQLMPNAVAFDPSDDAIAYAVLGGSGGSKFLRSSDGGITWDEVPSNSASSIATQSIPLTALAVSPFEADVVFAGTVAGVLQGKVSRSPLNVTWSYFSDGLPVPLDVTGLAVERSTGVLVASSMGFGAFECPISQGVQCTSPMLLVRDNVFDRGQPFSGGVPDPEHPVIGADGLARPDDSPGGKLYWWSSPDIRIEDPTRIPAGHEAPPPGMAALGATTADAVEVQTCPIDHADCPVGSLIDVAPVHGRTMRVHVVVENRGFVTARSVRVVALWADAAVGLGPLPNEFWTTFFKDDGTCGPFPTGSNWQLVAPCTTIDHIDPDQPATATFDWTVPAGAGPHCCMIALVDSPDDPIDALTRSELQTYKLVPESRHITQRNLHVIDAWSVILSKKWRAAFWLRNPWNRAATFDLAFSRAALPRVFDVRLALPPGSQWDSQGLAVLGKPTHTGKQTLRVKANAAALSHIALAANDSVRIGLEFVPQTGLKGAGTLPGRFSVVAQSDSVVVGGNTWIVRTKGPRRAPARHK